MRLAVLLLITALAEPATFVDPESGFQCTCSCHPPPRYSSYKLDEDGTIVESETDIIEEDESEEDSGTGRSQRPLSDAFDDASHYYSRQEEDGSSGPWGRRQRSGDVQMQDKGDRLLAHPDGNKKSLDDDESTTTTTEESGGEKAVKPIKVTIVYDTMCKFSRYFAITALWNVIKWIPDNFTDKAGAGNSSGDEDEDLWKPFNIFNMSFALLPFGNFKWDENGNVECQHGPKECELNHLHACLLKEIGGKRSFNATVCTIYHSSETIKKLSDTCISKDDQEIIKSCLDGDTVVDEITERVARSKHDFVPWIEINGEHREEGRSDLMSTICKYKQEDQGEPPFCQDRFLAEHRKRFLQTSSGDMAPWQKRLEWGVSWRYF